MLKQAAGRQTADSDCEYAKRAASLPEPRDFRSRDGEGESVTEVCFPPLLPFFVSTS